MIFFLFGLWFLTLSSSPSLSSRLRFASEHNFRMHADLACPNQRATTTTHKGTLNGKANQRERARMSLIRNMCVQIFIFADNMTWILLRRFSYYYPYVCIYKYMCVCTYSECIRIFWHGAVRLLHFLFNNNNNKYDETDATIDPMCSLCLDRIILRSCFVLFFFFREKCK